MTDLIGRVEEGGAIARFLDQVPDGPVGLLITGEPGIGKTTLVHEAIRAAKQRSYRVLRARPAEAEADLSFAVLSDVVGGAFDEVGVALPPPQREALEVALLRRRADGPADPRTTASALLTVVTLLCGAMPVVIAIDDAQWLDRSSRRAVEFTVRRLPGRVGVVLASRADADPGSTLDLERSLGPERVAHLELGPWSVAALHHLIASRLGLRLPRPILVRVAEASNGNPFYALEISAALARGPALPRSGDLLPLPRTLHGLPGDRLDRLSAPARDLATAAAALSRPTTDLLESALGNGLDVRAALLETEAAGILVPEGDRLRFSHPLLASALYGSLTLPRRRALHRRLAALVGDVEERARHLARSADPPDSDAADVIEEAAQLAARRGAPESAAELYEAASRLTPGAEPEGLARRILGAADALSVAGDLGGARSLAERALAIAPTGSLRARCLLLLGSIASYDKTVAVRIEHQERALAEAGDDVALRIEILLALFERISFDPEGAGRYADQAITLLRGCGDDAALAQALIQKFIAEAVLGHGAQGHLLEEALALEVRSAGPRSVYPLLWFHWIDDVAATRARYRLHERRYGDHGDVTAATEIAEFVAMAEFRAGNWPEAARLLGEACDALAQFDLRGPFIASFADRAVVDAHCGRIERARRTLLDILGPGGGDRADGGDHAGGELDPFWRMVAHSAQGSVEFCGGDYAAADRAWTTMRAEAQVAGWVDFLDDRSEPDHVEALVALGKVDEAVDVLGHLAWRGRTLPRAWIDAGLPRARALVMAAHGRLTEALAELDAAPPTPDLPFEAARLLLVRGQLERRINRKLAARDSLTRALERFEALGSPPWVQRARDELARIGLQHRGPTELTAGEFRIAELTAAGMTNREVAEAAFVSPKTVEANLARVYRKLGIRSRAELGAWMAARSGDGDAQT